MHLHPPHPLCHCTEGARPHYHSSAFVPRVMAAEAKAVSRLCPLCKAARVVMKRSRDGSRACKQCFIRSFEDEVHATILEHHMFHRGQRVALAASGGKGASEIRALGEAPARMLLPMRVAGRGDPI